METLSRNTIGFNNGEVSVWPAGSRAALLPTQPAPEGGFQGPRRVQLFTTDLDTAFLEEHLEFGT